MQVKKTQNLMPSNYLPMPVFSLNDADSLAKTDLTSCFLLMTTGGNHLHYAIYDPEAKKFIYLKGYYFDTKNNNQDTLYILEKCFDADKIVFTDFKQVKISFDNPTYTFVPSEYYSKEVKKDYFSMLLPSWDEQKICKDALADAALTNIYGVDKNLIGYLKKEFSLARYFHAETAFLQSVWPSSSEGNRIYVRVSAERVSLTVISGNKLCLAQSYNIKHTRDTLYYVLNSLSRFGMDRENVRLLLSGEVESGSSIFQELSYEVPGTTWLNRSDQYQFTAPFGEYPLHYFYNLTALASCE